MILPIKNINKVVKEVVKEVIKEEPEKSESEKKSTDGIKTTSSNDFNLKDLQPLPLFDFNPKDNADNVRTNTNIVLNFSEPVDYGDGNIVLYNAEDDSVVEKIRITSNQVKSKGSSIVSPDIFYEGNFFQISDGPSYDYVKIIRQIKNDSGHEWTDPDSINPSNFYNDWFSYIQKNYNVLLNGGSHSFNGNRVSISKTELQQGWAFFTLSGDYIRNAEGGFNNGVPRNKGTLTFIPKAGSKQFNIDLTEELEDDSYYYVHIDSEAFKDLSGNYFEGINDKTTFNFTTSDETSPTLISSSPQNNSKDIDTNTNLILNFSEAVNIGKGDILIYQDDSIVETIDVNSRKVSGGSTKKLLLTQIILSFQRQVIIFRYPIQHLRIKRVIPSKV